MQNPSILENESLLAPMSFGKTFFMALLFLSPVFIVAFLALVLRFFFY